MRRLLVALVVGGILGGLCASAVAAHAQAQAPPTVSIFSMSPFCGAQNSATRVQLTGAANRTSISISIYHPSGQQAGGPYTVSVTDGGWSTVLPLSPTQLGDYEFRVTNSTVSQSGYFRVPCQAPVLEYNPPCFVVGSTDTVTMTARNFPPFSSGYMYYDVNGSEAQTQIRLPVDGRGTFSATFKVAPSDRDHPGRGSDANNQYVATGTWSKCPPTPTTTSTVPDTVPDTTTTTRPTIPGSTSTTTTSTTIPTIVSIPPPTPGAALLVTPSLGPGGFVTTAIGSGFPANQPVTLGWSPGIGIYSVTAGNDGTFTSPVLIMNRDVLGPRTLVATSGGVSASASFLVVPSTVQPSGKDVAQITRVRRFLQR